ncbi:YeeE/YedE family protein [Azospirillum canadense]|uniref:YeeE/YedE family protein n=1 Tax=Azospirillum canadense TaxID=403962 RepID=UPI0022275553|nr:YeeE/YedE family protein [Azospirillum canadense]MCW2237282.1 putative membrane protein YedE/YeeE [Azospirillum canadense]
MPVEQFTPGSAAVGGVLIGSSVALLWLAAGRIAGISGILGDLLNPGGEDVVWRVAFLAGMIAAPWLYQLAGSVPPGGGPVVGSVLLAVAGGLVGFGTRLGNGCTSGHGVCGIARWSPRSLVATALFMVTAAGTVFVVRHVVGG